MSSGGFNNAINHWAFAAGCLAYLAVTATTYVYVVKEPLYSKGNPTDSKKAGWQAAQLPLGHLTAKAVEATPGDKEKERERERLNEVAFYAQATLWLVIVGILFVMALQLAAKNASGILLIGALGGFLSPVVQVVTRKSRGLAWGTILLAPVAGALTAFGGYLLVTLVSSCGLGLFDEKVSKALGLATECTTAFSTTAGMSLPLMGLALLLGFSGRLFASLALSAERFLGKSSEGTDRAA